MPGILSSAMLLRLSPWLSASCCNSKMTLLLVQVDLVNHFANYLQEEQHAVSESRFHFFKN